MKLKNKARTKSGLPFPVSFLINLGLILLGAVLFALSFPNPLFKNGLAALGWVVYIPVFIVIRRTKAGECVFFGALYGFSSYSLFNYWLSAFDPLAGLLLNALYLCYYAVLFSLLRFTITLFPRSYYIVQWILWICFEYIRTLGFLGYSYGISGYSQWNIIPVIQIADIFGVWGVSALVVFPSVFLAFLLGNRKAAAGVLRGEPPQRGAAEKLCFKAGGEASPLMVLRPLCPLIIWLAALAASLGYGFVSRAEYTDKRMVNIALVQHNVDPWIGGIEQYQENFYILKRLSEEALAQRPKPELVVWPETAFVPMIAWNLYYKKDAETYNLVRELLDFFKEQDTPFVIGNDDGQWIETIGESSLIDYNAAILFERGEMAGIYHKQHLVPFSEYFPYEKELPFIYDALVKADVHFWSKGTTPTVFSTQGFSFSTPICFEDGFGDISRDFTRNGAECLVNMSNDAWAHSLSAQMQHLAMSVFRAVENRRSVLRSTTSGQSCGIDPNGRILAMAEPFTETSLTVALPLNDTESFYTIHGDFLPRIFLISGLVMLICGLGVKGIRVLTRKPLIKGSRVG
ncbi:MAG: apolipoprotein N-acyltransferase [Spirochaetaceae bacterium]|nr:apolipoprotein N-acyltransferase [Spirochaetaceae bacterium]